MSSPRATEEMLVEKMTAVGASSCTFYVEDPWWPGELHLALMPGVKYPEPMHGFLIPLKSKRSVVEGKLVTTFINSEKAWKYHDSKDESVLHKLTKKNRLFGNFVEREGVKSSIRLIHRTGGKTAAVLFVNFDRKIKVFPKWMLAGLKDFVREICTPRFLQVFRKVLEKEDPFPLKQILRILQSAREHLSVTFEANLQRILQLAMEVTQLSPDTATGTIHAYDANKRILRLVETDGIKNKNFIDGLQSLNVDEGRGIVSWVALHRTDIMIHDLPKSEFQGIYIPTRKGIRSVLTVPILSGSEHLIGVLNLESKKREAFTPQSVRAVWCIANLAASIFRQADILRNLLRICSEASKQSGKPVSLNDLAELIRRFQCADMCDIWYTDSTRGTFEAVGATHATSPTSPLPRAQGEGWSHYVLRSKRPVLISNIKSKFKFDVSIWNPDVEEWQTRVKKGMPQSVNNLVLERQICEELAVPIMAKKECLGVAWLKYRQAGEAPRGQDAMESLFGFAGEIAMVLMSLHRQEELQLLSTNNGMKMLIRSLQHDVVGKIAGNIYTDIDRLLKNAKKNPTSTIKVPISSLQEWGWLIDLQKTMVFHLRRVAERSMTGLNPGNDKFRLADTVKKAIFVAELFQAVPPCKNEVASGLIVKADQKLILLTLVNLIQNAKKFTDDKNLDEPITISAAKTKKKRQNGILVTVDDAACGFPKELMDKIYTAPHVSGSHPASQSGTGLFLCSQFIQTHGGIMFKPEINRRGGTNFHFFLPTH